MSPVRPGSGADSPGIWPISGDLDRSA